MSERPTYPVGINVFVIKDGKLLLGKRKGSAGEGQWGLPGGHLELGEDMIEAAARELKEETSLESRAFSFVNLVNDRERGGTHYLQVGFHTNIARGEVKLMEPERCSEWRWFELDALPQDIFFGHERQVELFRSGLSYGESQKYIALWLVNPRGEVALQLRSSSDASYPSCWDFSAGGGIDAGETPGEAAIRELREELGVTDPVELEFVASTKSVYPDDLTIYKATYNGQFKLDPAEVDDVKWFPVEEVKKMISENPARFHPDVVFFFEHYDFK